MDTNSVCPVCGKSVVSGAPQGLCPECLMKSGFETKSGNQFGEEKLTFVPPSIEKMAKLFPQLEIIELLGQGGMGAVYKARQPRLNRFVGLKILSPEKQNNPQFAERFEREARALAWLNQPNIVTVHDFGETQGIFYLLMEFVDGMSLRQLMQTRRLTADEALAIVLQICQALQYAHEHGVIHRDIKPENILLDKNGQVKIADFGIAKLMEPEARDISLTGAADVVGTPHYMAPEQIEKPQTVDHRADIYSLGVVFYEMLTGELPLGNFPPPSQKVQIDVRLDEVVLHAMEKEPERRYQKAGEVKTAVDTIAGAGTPPANTEMFAQDILARDYHLDIGHCLSRGWALVFGDFWPVVGVTLLVLLLQTVALSALVGVFIGGPLMGGLFLYYLKKIRGEPAGAGTAFAGFSRAFLPLFLGSLIPKILMVMGFFCLVLPGIYLMVAWTFTLVLVIDKQMGFWAAMGLSRKIISKHWWTFFGFIIVLTLVNMAGSLLFFVGSLITVPICLAALMFAYEDIFNPKTDDLTSPVADASPTTGRSSHVLGWSLAGLLILLIIAGLAIHHVRRVFLNKMDAFAVTLETNSIAIGATPQASTSTNSLVNLNEAAGRTNLYAGKTPAPIIRLVEWGAGAHIADVTARVKELLHARPEGFTIDSKSLGIDPKPGRGKVLTIYYDYRSHASTFIIRAGEELSYQTLMANLNGQSSPLMTAETKSNLNSNAFESLLNHDQRIAWRYLNLKFENFFDGRTFEGWSPADRASLERRMIDTLKGPRSNEYYRAINTLAALHSTNALPDLRKLAFEHGDAMVRLERSNRPRWMAVRALGIMGDKPAVPGIIHLLYHNNSYVRWSAQITLVRLTGQNFGSDWRAWGRWWNAQGGNPPFNPAVIRWWRGQADSGELAKELAKADQRFLAIAQGKQPAENPPDKLTKMLSQ